MYHIEDNSKNASEGTVTLLKKDAIERNVQFDTANRSAYARSTIKTIKIDKLEVVKIFHCLWEFYLPERHVYEGMSAVEGNG